MISGFTDGPDARTGCLAAKTSTFLARSKISRERLRFALHRIALYLCFLD